MHAVSVVLFDPSKLSREGLRALLQGSEFDVGAVGAGIADLEAVAQAVHEPQIVLYDPAGADVHEAVAALRLRFPRARILILTAEREARAIVVAMQAGADGCLVKDIAPEALIQSLRLVMTGEKVFPSHLATLLVQGNLHHDDRVATATGRTLSPREAEILRCLVNGDSNKQIAAQLGITDATVKVHLKSLLRKIGVSNRTQAAIWALDYFRIGAANHGNPGGRNDRGR